MIHYITTSAMKTFKSCPMKYYFEYVLGLVPLQVPKALSIGSLYHVGLEMLEKGGADLDYIESHLREAELERCDRTGAKFNEFDFCLAMEMIRAFDAGSGWREWKVVAVEKQYEVTTGYAKRMLGKLDGLIEIEGKRFILEHKTSAKFGERYLNNLLWDEQSTNYCFAYQRMLEDGVIDGGQIYGVFYCITEKALLRPFIKTVDIKYNKDGSVKKGQHLADETPEEFRERLHEWYAAEPRVHTTLVNHTAKDLEERIKEFNATLKVILQAERDGAFYRNPANCRELECPYACKCLENTPDTDVLFRVKERTNEELSKEEN